MKKKIIIFLIALLVALPVSAGANKYATVYHPDTGHRKSITVGDPKAFIGGYVLETKIGATVPSVVADFQTSLAQKVSLTETATMTLVSATTDDGTTLSGTYGFTLDEGNSSNKEYIIATCSGTTCTNLIRGISVVTGSSSVAALTKEHRRGASVKITDHPVIAVMVNILNGRDSLPGSLYYLSHPSGLSASTTIMDKDYIDTVGAGGFTSLNASTTRGVSVDGSSPERVGVNASSTSGLSFNADGSLQITASTTGGIKADSNGIYIDGSDDLTFSGNNTFSGTTTIPLLSHRGFGGIGTDGSLNVTSGTTTIDAASSNVVIKNYTSINIATGSVLTLNNTPASGTILILKSQGNCNIAGKIDLQGKGATSTTGSNGYGIVDDLTDHYGGAGGNGDNSGNPGSAGATSTIFSNKFLYTTPNAGRLSRKMIIIAVGSSGGKGGDGATSNGSNPAGVGGVGGMGGGSIIIECGGYLNFVAGAEINVSGMSGSNGTSASGSVDARASGGGGGAGGSAGMVLVLYNNLITNSGTINAKGGAGGNGGNGKSGSSGNCGGGGSGAGGSSYSYAGKGGKTGASNNANGLNGDNSVNSEGASGGAGGSGSGSGGTGGTAGASDANHYLIAQNYYY